MVLGWEAVALSQDALLDGSDVSFGLWNVLVLRHNIDVDVEIGKVALQRLKLIVRQDNFDSKTPPTVCVNDSFEVCQKICGQQSQI